MINDLFLLVEKKFRLKLILLFLGMLIASILEILSIGSIPIFLNVLLSTGSVYSIFDFNLNFLKDFTLDWDDQKILLVVSAFLVFIFGIKNTFLSILIYFEAKFIYDIKVSNSLRLFKSYLDLPYIEHVNTNSSKIIRNIIHENYQASSILQLTLISLREGLVMLVVFVFLLLISFFGIISLLTLGLLSSVFFIIFKSKLKKRGLIAQEKRADVLQKINEASGSIKDIKVLGIENFVSQDFEKDVVEIEKNTLFEQVLSKLPRIIIEFFAILIIFLVSLAALKLNFETEYLISVLSLIGVSTIRLMPAFNAITSCSTKIRYLYPSLNIIAVKFKNLIVEETSKNQSLKIIPKDFKTLNLENVSFFYEDIKKIFDNFSLQLKKGQKIAIVGKSGSGKSTLLDLILGLLTPKGGRILINNLQYNSNNNYFSYVPQNIYLLDNSIKKNITLGNEEREIDENFLKKIISICELDELVNQLPNGLNTLVGEKGSLISGGQKQRIAIARALYSNREILILDEGTNALDEFTERKIISNIFDNFSNKTLIFTTHKNNILKYFDSVIEINNS